jgi:hypothetical protein
MIKDEITREIRKIAHEEYESFVASKSLCLWERLGEAWFPSCLIAESAQLSDNPQGYNFCPYCGRPIQRKIIKKKGLP